MIEYRNVNKRYDSKIIANNLNLTIKDGEFVVIIGSSGCGKTTTVKMLNRMTSIDSGEIFIDGRNINDINEVELRTGIGYVVQEIGLFPNMTVEENISIVPWIKKWNKAETVARVKELMTMVNMPYEEYAAKYPRQLSGGQQQRVGVLRALAARPPILIMDEPFGALDPVTRVILQDETKKIQKQLGITVLFITHDMHETVKLADRILFMDHGEIVQDATPEVMLSSPATDEVRKFMQMQEVGETPLTCCAGELVVPLAKDACVDSKGMYVHDHDDIQTVYEVTKNHPNERIYVQNKEGKLLGEITVEGLLSFAASKVNNSNE